VIRSHDVGREELFPVDQDSKLIAYGELLFMSIDIERRDARLLPLDGVQ
jgi:hypothetical protein